MNTIALALMFVQASQTFHLPPKLLESLCYVESAHDVTAVHEDDGLEDSLGVCQVHLSTARMMGFKGTYKELMQPTTNIHYAAAYLNHLFKRYHNDLPKAVTAYNKGHCTDDGQSNYYHLVQNAWIQNKSLDSSHTYASQNRKPAMDQ